MFGKLAKEEKIKGLLSVLLQMWTGILLVYTSEMNPLIGFLMSAVLWRLTILDGKRKLNAKKLLLITLLVSVSGNYKASDFMLNAAVGVTVFQVINFFISSKEKSWQSWLQMVYVTMAIYYTLRMTLVFEVPEILLTAHELYMSAEEYLTANKKIELAIFLSLIAINMAILFKSRTQEHLPLIMGLISGLCGLEDVSMIIILSLVGKMVFKIKNGDEEENECEKPVQQAGKIYKL
ncbi:MAG: hypothetical protein IJQ82_11705 [Selenomonadaceae bacterium]|nr:hypothetical protein [Selenomonadaceae bacterium]